MKEKDCWLGLSVFSGIGSRRFQLLYQHFKSAEKIWQAKKDTLLATGLPAKIVDEFLRFRQKFNPDFYASWLEKRGIKFVTLLDKNYPKNLKEIDGPPFVLYYQGEIKKEDELSLGVVGTRRPTVYGRQVTENLVADLVGCGLTIISGLARGIDTLAHKTALQYNGRTIAVFASGLDIVYPPENKKLAKEIVKNGALVSEYPPGTKPSLGSFPYRNRIVSGLSLGVLVIEGAERSGSLITARKAAEQGREVFAVPGPITSKMSAATAKLLKQGAKPTTDVVDILEELKINLKMKNLKLKTSSQADSASSEEKILLEILENGALHIDEIVRQSHLKAGQVASLLTILEIKGKVRNLGGMVYGLNHR